MFGRMQASHVFKMGLPHAQTFGFGVHLRHKGRFAARHAFGQCQRRIVARQNQHAVQQVDGIGLAAAFQKHAVARAFPRVFGNRPFLFGRDGLRVQRFEGQIGHHQMR